MELTRPDGNPLRVLVVDDEVNIAELISMALRYEGWQVQAAYTGSKAVAATKRFRPDAVVLDMMLPDFDGMEVLRQRPALHPPGTTVTITVRRDGFSVHDDGPGFSPELVGHAFERFARGDAARTRGEEVGVGLGLALVQAIVAAHGGTVTLSSVPAHTRVAPPPGG